MLNLFKKNEHETFSRAYLAGADVRADVDGLQGRKQTQLFLLSCPLLYSKGEIKVLRWKKTLYQKFFNFHPKSSRKYLLKGLFTKKSNFHSRFRIIWWYLINRSHVKFRSKVESCRHIGKRLQLWQENNNRNRKDTLYRAKFYI